MRGDIVYDATDTGIATELQDENYLSRRGRLPPPYPRLFEIEPTIMDSAPPLRVEVRLNIFITRPRGKGDT